MNLSNNFNHSFAIVEKTMESPLVSVVTPSYNHAKFIQKTIESVVNQTYKNIEYFIVDDGSTDESQGIIKHMNDKYKFYFECQKNSGLASTMNKLISFCNGKYIAILESDDLWALDKIEKQVVYMENNPSIGACGGNILNINEKDEILPFYFQRFKPHTVFDFHDIITFNYYLPSLSVIIRKEALEKVGTYNKDLKFIDYFSWLRITYHKYKISMLNDLFGFYRIHENNTSKDNKLILNGKLSILHEYNQENGYLKGILKAFSYYYLHCFLQIVPQKIFPFSKK